MDGQWLVLPITPRLVSRLRPEAVHVSEQYRERFHSVYETSVERVLQGLVAEEVLRLHRGVPRASVYRPWETPYDVWPDIEVRCVIRPAKSEWWDGVTLTLYERDRKALDRRWVLAMLDYEREDVRYLGWETGPALLLAKPVRATSRKGKSYLIIGSVYPDELRPMASLE